VKPAVIVYRLLLLPQFALFLFELLREVRVLVYTYRFHRWYPLSEGSCFAEPFSWQNALMMAVLTLALVSVIGLAGFRSWGRASYLGFVAIFLVTLPFLGPYDCEVVAVIVALGAVFAVTAILPFIRSIRAEFPSKVA
jgi:ABC-type branched-subunit amino acid transport system permease subunit